MCRWIETKTVHNCARAVFTATGAAAAYSARYPDIVAERWAIIPNGYEESNFSGLDETASATEVRPLQLVHSGRLYPESRNPRSLFQAISRLKKANKLSANDVCLTLRAAGSEGYYRRMAEDADIADIIRLEPPVVHKQALAELCRADGLLIMQGREHNGQIPAKIYEYMRSRRPILALTDPVGDTAQTLRDAGIDTIAPLDQADAIFVKLADFIDHVRAGTAARASETAIADSTREAGTRELARLFNSIMGGEQRRK
jgi:hypothetical protein